jgi:hypothetical protein
MVQLWISNTASTTSYKLINFLAAYDNTSPVSADVSGGGAYYGDVNAVTALRVIMSSGNITSGQCSLYGMN